MGFTPVCLRSSLLPSHWRQMAACEACQRCGSNVFYPQIKMLGDFRFNHKTVKWATISWSLSWLVWDQEQGSRDETCAVVQSRCEFTAYWVLPIKLSKVSDFNMYNSVKFFSCPSFGALIALKSCTFKWAKIKHKKHSQMLSVLGLLLCFKLTDAIGHF